MSRRSFLAGLSVGSGAVAIAVYTGVALLDESPGPDGGPPTTPPVSESPPPTAVAVAEAHPRVRVASLNELGSGDVIDFLYPTEASAASLVRLGRPAAGGIGPDGDIVAFATDCTHMGCPLRGLYRADHGILGPCPCHYSTFDLVHRGMVVLGQATENLPQVILDLEGDDIVAVGTLGILYGFRDNLADVRLVEGM